MRAQYGYGKDCVMKGYVTKLCDIDSIGIPDEMFEVHIDKERIEKQIAALPLRYANEISSIICAQTDILYGKDGDMVAAYTYIEGKDKASTDKIAESYKNEERVSDTAIMIAYTGDEMASVLDRYMGCNVIKDRSVAEYTRMIEETFFSVVYEE